MKKKIFVCSTSEDLKPYRAAVGDAIKEAECEPMMMEYFRGGTEPIAQDLAGRVRPCQLVIALIGWRKGSVALREQGGDGAKTFVEWELQVAAEHRIPIVYFMAGSLWEVEFVAHEPDERAWVDAFRSSLRNIATMFHSVGAEGDPLHKLRLDVREAIHRLAVEAKLAALPDYLAAARDKHREHCTATGERSHATLQDVYVELGVQPEELLADLSEGNRELAQGLTLSNLIDWGRQRPQPVRRWLLRGDPGTGKTTVLRHLALTLCDAALAEGAPPDAPIPVFVPLAELVEATNEEVLSFVAARIVSARKQDVAQALEHTADQDRLVVLLDGLDEVDDASSAQERITRLTRKWPKATIVVSSRYVPDRSAVLPGAERELPFAKVDLRKFTLDQIERFLQQWCVDPDFEATKSRAGSTWTPESALDEIKSRPGLRDLAEVPLLLTMLAQQADRGEALNEHRMGLYHATIRGLFTKAYAARIGKRKSPRDGIDRIIDVLAAVAFALTHRNDARVDTITLEDLFFDDDGVCAAWTRAKSRLESASGRPASVSTFLEWVERETNLLRRSPAADSAIETWEFSHRTYREALAAMVLANMDPPTLLTFAQEHGHEESAWIEPLVMAVGSLDQGRAPDDLVVALLKDHPHVAYRVLATARNLRPDTAGGILDLIHDDLDKRRDAITKIPDRVADATDAMELILHLVESGDSFDPNDLYFAHLALLRLEARDKDGAAIAPQAIDRLYGRLRPVPAGPLFEKIRIHPLRDVADKEIPLWHHVPAGTGFRMGSPDDEPDRSGDEGPTHTVRFQRGFHISTVPIANGLFRAFCPSFAAEEWKGVSNDDLAFHPAVNITWYAASAFCEWLSRRSGDRFTEVRLPTEAEWECATRAGTDTAYNGGNDKAALQQVGWYEDNSERRTHRVGELGANDWGLYDVHGNVWEWTSDWASRKYTSSAEADPRGPDSGVSRVVRGGSWNFPARYCRSAFRDVRLPSVRYQYLGFRVVAAVAPEREDGS